MNMRSHSRAGERTLVHPKVKSLRSRGLEVRDLSGVVYNPLSDSFRLDARDISVNYLLTAENNAGR